MAPEADIGGTGASERPRLALHRPTQERGRRRFESILDAADRLLQRVDPVNFSINALAGEAGVSTQSIYQYFRSPSVVLAALAERYAFETPTRTGQALPPDIRTWEQFDAQIFERAREFLQAHISAQKLLFGTGHSGESPMRDHDEDVLIAESGFMAFSRVFVLPPGENLLDRFLELLVISNAIWALSFHRHGHITDEMAARARLARVAYARTFLPERLELRNAQDQERNR